MKQLFDVYERKLILTYYRNPNMWYQKPSVVKNLEMMRAKRNFERDFKKTSMYKIINKFNNFLEMILTKWKL